MAAFKVDVKTDIHSCLVQRGRTSVEHMPSVYVGLFGNTVTVCLQLIAEQK